MRLLIVEDEEVIAEDLRARVEDIGYQVVGTAVTCRQAISRASKFMPDLILMDIELKGPKTGIEAAAEIWGKLGIPVVFLSSHSEQAYLDDAKNAEPFGYLVKPFPDEILKSTIEIAMHRYYLWVKAEQSHPGPAKGSTRRNFFFIKQGALLQKIRYEEILWIQSIKDYTKIKTVGGIFYHRGTIKSIAQWLDQDEFVRVHKSYIVPLERIDSIEENTLSMAGKLIPIGRTYRVELMRKLDFI